MLGTIIAMVSAPTMVYAVNHQTPNHARITEVTLHCIPLFSGPWCWGTPDPPYTGPCNGCNGVRG
jgi:hypothetical protein